MNLDITTIILVIVTVLVAGYFLERSTIDPRTRGYIYLGGFVIAVLVALRLLGLI